MAPVALAVCRQGSRRRLAAHPERLAVTAEIRRKSAISLMPARRVAAEQRQTPVEMAACRLPGRLAVPVERGTERRAVVAAELADLVVLVALVVPVLLVLAELERRRLPGLGALAAGPGERAPLLVAQGPKDMTA